MLFSDTFDAVARVAGISFRGRNEMTNFVGTQCRGAKHVRHEVDALTDIEPVSHKPNFSSCANGGNTVGGAFVVLVLVQEAGNLSSQRGRLQHVPQRTCGIEQLAFELRRDRVPLHDDGRPKTSKDMLLDFCDSSAVGAFPGDVVLRVDVLRLDNFIEIDCKPVFVLRQRAEALLRSLKRANFTRNIGMFERFGAFCCFCAKFVCREHGKSPP
jgi:hypothetical protein